MNFSIEGEDLKKYNEWYKYHKPRCRIKDTGAIGGGITFSFSPTGLGVVTVVKCACGEELDLTDYKNW